MKNHKTDTAPESRGLGDQGVECGPSEGSAAWWRICFGSRGSRVRIPPLRPTSEGLAARLPPGPFSFPFFISQSPPPPPPPPRPTSEGLGARLPQVFFSCPFVIAQSPRPAPQPIHQSAAASAKPWRPWDSGASNPAALTLTPSDR